MLMRPQKSLSLLAIAAALVCGLASAQVEQTAPPGTPASGTSAPDSVTSKAKSLLDSFMNRIKALPAAPASSATDNPASAPAASASLAAEPPAAPARADQTKVIEITNWSTTANVVLDPECKNLVQPFTIGDNMASLASLGAQIWGSGAVEKLLGQASNSPDPKAVIRQAARGLNWLPMDLEVMLGQHMLKDEEYLAEDKNKDVAKAYKKARDILADLQKDLPKDVPYQFQVYVRSSSFGNASALPGGIILVDRDLFSTGSDPDYVRFVMAHEISHVLQRHLTREYQARLLDGVDSVDGLKKLITSMNEKNPQAVLQYALKVKNLFVNFTEDQELQADSCAMRFMANTYPDKVALHHKLEHVVQQLGPITPAQQLSANTDPNTLPDVLKHLTDGVYERHPNTERRAQNLRKGTPKAFAQGV